MPPSLLALRDGLRTVCLKVPRAASARFHI
jgi:hypothetical protein